MNTISIKNGNSSSSYFQRFITTILFAAIVTLSLFIFVLFSNAGMPMVPVNNECLMSLSLSDGTTPFSTIGATTEPPSFSCTSGGSEIWYTYNASCTGDLTIDTCGSGYDTVLDAYDTDICADVGLPTELACNDDNGIGACPSSLDSLIEFPVTQGDDYIVRVGGFSGATGSGSINVFCDSIVPNNDCVDSIEVFNGTTPFNNTGTTTSSPDFSCGIGTTDLWYDYTATCTGDVTFQTCGSPTLTDTVLELYDTDNCANVAGSSAICNDDSCGLNSSFTHPVVQGDTYLVRVGGWSGSTGEGVLDIIPQGSCKESACIFKKNAQNPIKVRNASPNKKVRVVWGYKKGNGTLSGTKCDGLPLGIAPNQSIATLMMNGNGNLNNGKMFIPSTSANKAFMQMVDLKTCTAGAVRKVLLTPDGPPNSCVYTFDSQPPPP